MPANQWENKIVGHDEVAPDQLLAHPDNWRLHPKNQQEALAGAIDDIGFIRSVTVSKRTGRVLDGHLRVTLALRTHQKSIPVEYVDLTEAEEAEALATLDPIAAMAAADKAKLDELMRQVQSDDARVQQMMSDLAQKEGIVSPDFQPVGVEEQGRLDEKKKVVCPECGHEFTP